MAKSTDMCKCGHPRSSHNNRSEGAIYHYEMRYNCCHECLYNMIHKSGKMECMHFRLERFNP